MILLTILDPSIPYPPTPLCLQSQAGASDLGKQLAEVESLLQKQDLLEAQISAHGETITAISSTALKVQYLFIIIQQGILRHIHHV